MNTKTTARKQCKLAAKEKKKREETCEKLSFVSMRILDTCHLITLACCTKQSDSVQFIVDRLVTKSGSEHLHFNIYKAVHNK